MNEHILIGRETETGILQECLQSNKAELIAMIGRRRVGKTFLIREFYKNELCFVLTGVHHATLEEQLENFQFSMIEFAKTNKKTAPPKTWLQAFHQLRTFIEKKGAKKKKVLFFDELPWMATRRSGFMGAFEHFWNHWASHRKDLILVICGSAASWMIKKIVNNKGGLHNRITRKIRLEPFDLHETECFLKNKNVNLNQYQVTQLFMVTGGIPLYLNEIKKGESAAQNIERICFTKDGLLQKEFDNLYSALYEDATNHIAVIKALSGKNKGMNRTEIIKAAGLKSGGFATEILEELSESGFITPFIPLDRVKKETFYRLTDEYTLFYLKFIAGQRGTGKKQWVKKANSPSWKSWSGLAFENICIKHTPQIKKALGIEGVYTEESAWRSKNKKEGVQVDLLIDRGDNCINVCEMKFSQTKFEINNRYAKELQNKIQTFQLESKTRKTVFLTMITTFGLIENIHKTSLVSNSIPLEKLFIKITE
ncbi:MAG: ATP-binding protein [Bacteroidia bacterium]|nr:ATP-binding protein [Bacteroidia bacterium]